LKISPEKELKGEQRKDKIRETLNMEKILKKK